MKKRKFLIVVIIGLLWFCYDYLENNNNLSYASDYNIPSTNEDGYTILNDNKSTFTSTDVVGDTYEEYSELDSLGRSGTATALLHKSIMPTKKRESIGSIKPSGWHTVKYSNIDGLYLYNRCHLIGYQLTGQNKNPLNLITCTRQMNTGVMLEYENKVANYLKETNNHVLYRVTPVYEDKNLLASGVIMEAKSVKDNNLEFNIYVYNIQDGIEINYLTGDSSKK